MESRCAGSVGSGRRSFLNRRRRFSGSRGPFSNRRTHTIRSRNRIVRRDNIAICNSIIRRSIVARRNRLGCRIRVSGRYIIGNRDRIVSRRPNDSRSRYRSQTRTQEHRTPQQQNARCGPHRGNAQTLRHDETHAPAPGFRSGKSRSGGFRRRKFRSGNNLCR